MPGITPLRNAFLASTADFNNQGVTGATGGTFRNFNSNIVNINSGYDVSSPDIYKILRYSETNGNLNFNSSNLAGAPVGAEILIYSTTGTLTLNLTGGIAPLPSKYTLLPNLLYRLVHVGSNNWRISGQSGSYYSLSVFDCCSVSLPPVYQLNNSSGVLNTSLAVYDDSFGSVATNENQVVIGAYVYDISAGIASLSECFVTDYTNSYTFYNAGGGTFTFYTTTIGLDILDNGVIAGYKFKTTNLSAFPPCDNSYNVTDGVVYYRAWDPLYSLASYPVCFLNGYPTYFNEYCT